MLPTNETQYQNPGKPREKRTPLKFAERPPEFTMVKRNPKVHWEKQNKKGTKEAREKRKPYLRFLRPRISRDYSLSGCFMNALNTKRLAKCARNSLWLYNAIRDVNKTCKASYQKKPSWRPLRL